VIRVELYGAPDCHLCDAVKATLVRVRRDIPFELREVDITVTPTLAETYRERIPLVLIDGRRAFKFRVDEAALRRYLLRERMAPRVTRFLSPRARKGLHACFSMRRRSVLTWFVRTSWGAFLASMLYPVTRFLIPPRVGESAAASVTIEIEPTSLKPNSGRIIKFGTRPAILVRTPANELRAFSAVCTHLACTVQYREDLQHIWCACHNGHYDLYGRNIAGPPPRPLEPYAVNVRGRTIVVSRRSPGSARA
jgi:Rieske Fe-S protein